MPFAEQTVQNPYVVYHMEYQVQKSIIPQEIIAIWLHTWDGNSDRIQQRIDPTLRMSLAMPSIRRRWLAAINASFFRQIP